MAGDTQITVVGNLVSDPELRYTPTGVAVANFRVASTPRTFDRQANEWKDGDSLFLTCNVWRQAAENVAESLQRGMRVIVMGRLHQRSYETREGEKRTVFEIEVDDVGPSMRNASAKVAKSNRSGGGRWRLRRRHRRSVVAAAAVTAASAAAARADPAGMVGRPAAAAVAAAAAAVMTPGPRTRPGSVARDRRTSRRSDLTHPGGRAPARPAWPPLRRQTKPSPRQAGLSSGAP